MLKFQIESWNQTLTPKLPELSPNLTYRYR
jgi:hypothetical protein